MSGNLKLYSIVFAGINGPTLVEEQEIDIERSSGAQPIHTVAGGFSGVSPGSGLTQINIKSAIPAAGFEFDAGKSINGLIPVDVQVSCAGKTLTGQAFIISDSIRHGVNQEATYSFVAWMPPALFQ